MENLVFVCYRAWFLWELPVTFILWTVTAFNEDLNWISVRVCCFWVQRLNLVSSLYNHQIFQTAPLIRLKRNFISLCLVWQHQRKVLDKRICLCDSGIKSFCLYLHLYMLHSLPEILEIRHLDAPLQTKCSWKTKTASLLNSFAQRHRTP